MALRSMDPQRRLLYDRDCTLPSTLPVSRLGSRAQARHAVYSPGRGVQPPLSPSPGGGGSREAALGGKGVGAEGEVVEKAGGGWGGMKKHQQAGDLQQGSPGGGEEDAKAGGGWGGMKKHQQAGDLQQGSPGGGEDEAKAGGGWGGMKKHQQAGDLQQGSPSGSEDEAKAPRASIAVRSSGSFKNSVAMGGEQGSPGGGEEDAKAGGGWGGMKKHQQAGELQQGSPGGGEEDAKAGGGWGGMKKHQQAGDLNGASGMEAAALLQVLHEGVQGQLAKALALDEATGWLVTSPLGLNIAS
jgi:hypothetical protein